VLLAKTCSDKTRDNDFKLKDSRCGFEQPDLVKDISAHGRGYWTKRSLKVPSKPNILFFYKSTKIFQISSHSYRFILIIFIFINTLLRKVYNRIVLSLGFIGILNGVSPRLTG